MVTLIFILNVKINSIVSSTCVVSYKTKKVLFLNKAKLESLFKSCKVILIKTTSIRFIGFRFLFSNTK